eukprot:jgi/Undpi1/5260/HiC_scaffold_2.g00541.m1
MKKTTWKTTAVALVSALALGQPFARAQTIYSVADCTDLEALPSMSTDAVVDFTASPISCDTNTNVRVTEDSTLELTSSLEELKLVNIRLSLSSGTSLVVSAPNLQWQSQETREDRVAAAMYVAGGATATFEEAVNFTACSIVEQSGSGWSGGAIFNRGNLEFMSDATFVGTTEFAGDARFEDNKKSNAFRDGGGAIHTEDGDITFKGAASFIGNEAEGSYEEYSEGIVYNGGYGGGLLIGVDNGNFSVVFEGPAFFSGNKAMSVGDASGGGAMAVYDGVVEFEAGVVATGNIAKDGGVFKLMTSDAVINIEGPVTMTNNEARYRGGAIWNAGNVKIPQDADISGNTAPTCPGIKNFEDWERDLPIYSRSWSEPDGSVEFTGDGSTFSGSSVDLCYLGENVGTDPDFQLTIDSDAADCDALFGEGTTLGGYSVLTWDTRVVSEVNFAVGSGDTFDVTCANQSIIFVMGGGDLTVTSTTDAMVFSNIRFEIGGYSNLYFDVPDLTMTGISSSPIGGSTHVDKGSSLEFLGDVSFLGNTLAYLTDPAWNEYGGACVFNAGLVKFHGQAYFRYNGQFRKDGTYEWNAPGGAILNIGDMEFERKTKFWDNFNLRGGNGGGIANSGQLQFHYRTVWRNNTVDDRNEEEGPAIFGGHGAALYNFGPIATATFMSKATFRDNVGGFRGAAVAANGDRGGSDSTAENANKITFEHKTYFKDNSFDDTRPDNGGAGLWVFKNATVEFQDRVAFRRNIGANGGAIINGGGFIHFAAANLIHMIDNVGEESCPDIKNYDTETHSHEDGFGDIDDPSGECGSTGDLCTWFEGEITIGSADPIVGETPDICEF